MSDIQEENEYSNYCNEELRKKITNLEYKIERLEEDNKQLKDLCDKYEEEHNTTFQIWKYNKDTYKEENERLNNIINKAIELLNDWNYLDKIDCYYEPKEVIDILKGDNK